jgi:hypothetical protein
MLGVLPAQPPAGCHWCWSCNLRVHCAEPWLEEQWLLLLLLLLQ